MALSDQIEELAKKHGATSYRNRADTQHPAYGFTPAQLRSLVAEVRRQDEALIQQLVKPLVVSLYDKTGQMMKPWVDSGCMALLVDLQHPPGLTTEDGVVWRLGVDLRSGFKMPEGLPAYSHIEFAAAFPPCDHLAVSGARWFKGKGLRALALSVDLFATAADACESFGCPYQIENPVSTISTYWRTPDYTFHPHYFSGHCADDNYTKKTCLWTGGGFVMPERFEDLLAGPPDDRIHKMPPGPERANKRSATPLGYATAVYLANCWEARLGVAA